MDNEGVFLRKTIFIVAFGDTIIVNYQLSIVHFVMLYAKKNQSRRTGSFD